MSGWGQGDGKDDEPSYDARLALEVRKVEVEAATSLAMSAAMAEERALLAEVRLRPAAAASLREAARERRGLAARLLEGLGG